MTVEWLGRLIDPARGQVAALAAALFWAAASVIWVRAGERIRPLQLNLLKGLIGISLIALTLALRGDLFVPVERRALLYLGVSGAVGIGLGDTAYFDSLNCLGARRALLLTLIAPPLAGLTAWWLLGERLGPFAWLGMALTVGGLTWVITEKNPGTGGGRTRTLRGVTVGVAAAIAQVVGAVLSRAAFAQTEVTPLFSALLRMSAAVVTVLACMSFSRRKSCWAVRHPRDLWRLVFAATFIGTFLGISLQQFAFKYADTGVTQTLLSTSPLFILPIAMWMGEKLSIRSVAGAVIGLIGIAMLFGIFG
jgi:drug/metabolite transporter (DMT)-like permease